MVFTFRPACAATSMKDVSSAGVFGTPLSSLRKPDTGRARARTPRSGSTRLDLLRDFRNARRVEDKRGNSFLSLDRATMRRYFYSERLRPFASCENIPAHCVAPEACSADCRAGRGICAACPRRRNRSTRTFPQRPALGIFLRNRPAGGPLRKRKREPGGMGLSPEDLPQFSH